jgi:hypothetical protein
LEATLEQIKCVSDTDVLCLTDCETCLEDLSSLLGHLYYRGTGGVAKMSEHTFRTLLELPDTILAFVVEEGRIVATAQAQLFMSANKFTAFISNVVNHPDYDADAYDQLVLSYLKKEIDSKWGQFHPVRKRLSGEMSDTALVF